MAITKNYVQQSNILVPKIVGGKGKGASAKEDVNNLFSTDILFALTALGEGPLYRINPNGPQDIEINDSAIDDLINLNGDGSENEDVFKTLSTAGTITQSPLRVFGESVTTPQSFASPVSLKKGNIATPTKVESQQTSARAWDKIRFNFVVSALLDGDEEGNVYAHSLTVKITIKNSSFNEITSVTRTVTGKTTSEFKFSVTVVIPEASKDDNGYYFTVEKTSNESDKSRTQDQVRIIGWDEIENDDFAYPRTALIGYALKSANEHTGSVPTFSSMIKGLIVKVPSNYNQPVIYNSQTSSYDVDWREVEVGSANRITYGYRLQDDTATVLTDANPQIYKGVWDGTFVYNWTQNPVWIILDILTNTTYGLGIPIENIDKYKFYQVAMYCDSCDVTTGQFQGVAGISDGSYRYKPRGTFTSVKEVLRGLDLGTAIDERRFILDITISDQQQAMDSINTLCASFRAALVPSGGKITLAVDMPDEYPVMLFNETNIQDGSFKISGNKESDIVTAVEVSYIEPANHFKREVIRVDSADANDGRNIPKVDNTLNIDLKGVTRRGQALRMAQYQLAATKYQRRLVNFVTSIDALSLTPGDVISVSTRLSGINYGYGGKVTANSSTSGNANVLLEHFTQPSISSATFTDNTYPIALRVIKTESDRMDLYVLSDVDYSLFSTNNVSIGNDLVEVRALQRYNPITKTLDSITSFSANDAPVAGDIWSLGEWTDVGNIYSNKAEKLFKVTELTKDSKEYTVDISAVEYIPNVYADADTFISYEPTAYTDVQSSLVAPPPPSFKFYARPRKVSDGSVVVDGVLEESTDRSIYRDQFETEFYHASPDATTLVSNATPGTPISLIVDNTSAISGEISSAILSGKNGFSGQVGEINLLCNAIALTDEAGSVPTRIELTVEGLSSLYDENFSNHVLAVNDGTHTDVKGSDYASVPIQEKTDGTTNKGFISYYSFLTDYTSEIKSYDAANNKLKIENTFVGGVLLSDLLENPPFHFKVQQLLYSNFYSAANSFYVPGSFLSYAKQGSVTESTVNYIDLPVEPRSQKFITLYVDGIEKTSGQFTYNKNSGSALKPNVEYSAISGDSEYKIEADYYTVPVFEVGDNVSTSTGEVLSIINTSYDTTSAKYNTALTSNCLYRVYTDKAPSANLLGQQFINISSNPVGTIGNVSSNTATFDYNSTTYPGTFNLGNNLVYTLNLNAEFDKIFSKSKERVIENLPVGTTLVKARNRNLIGRVSDYVEKSVTVDTLPISKVTGINITESIYREQSGGVAVRATVSFPAIEGQEVTDYEISYKLLKVENIDGNDAGTDLTSYNTVKVPATGVDSDGKIRFTVSNINRGQEERDNTITFRITPLNRNIRGVAATAFKTIVGKTATPLNIFNFTGGQQTDQITLLWSYPRVNDELADLDLKEVVIRRAPGNISATIDNFLGADALVTVSAGTARKSIPIDTYGTYTYLARTRDTSGNFSEDVVSITLTTSKPNRSTVIAAYNEDSPSTVFAGITNDNDSEFNYPSFANSTTGGIAYNVSDPNYGSPVDNANGTSSGWSAISGSPTDLLATSSAEYTTQIRDLGFITAASVQLDLSFSQEVQSTFNDQQTDYLESVSDTSGSTSVLVDADFGGIGHILGFSNASVSNPRYDDSNKTWMTGGTNGNVWGIWNHGQYTGDTANANSYALIAGLINSNAIALGESFYANGEPTGSNAFGNVAVSGNTYTLVDFTQYNDTGSTQTFAGDLGAVTTQTFIRTSSADPSDLFYANGNVNTSFFDAGTVNDGYVKYQAGTRNFRYFQIKFIVNNSKPEEFDFTIDKFRYTINKEQTIFSNTAVYDASPKTVSMSDSGFLNRPTISYAVLDQADAEANPAIVVTTAASNNSLSFKLLASDGTGEYQANSTATVMITATGV